MNFLFWKKPDIDPHFLMLEHQGGRIKVAIKRRSSAHRMILRVSSATGQAVLTLSPRADLEAAKGFIVTQKDWIIARLSKVPQKIGFHPGAVVPFKGIPHRILHWSQSPGATQAMHDRDGQPVLAVAGTESGIARRVKLFLRSEAQKALEEAVRVYAAKLDVKVNAITLRDTKSRWGSCSSKGNLNFSWRLIMAPPHILDYLAAHEVAHLREMNHSARYWSLLHGLCPHVEEAERWLKKHGASLHRYG